MQGELDHELLEKVAVAVSAANACDYCVNAHALSLVRNVDATDDEITVIREARFADLPERERIATAFGAAAARAPKDVPDERVRDLREEFSPGEVVEIVGVVQLFQGLNLAADALEVPVDEAGDAVAAPGDD
jgi:AhpD family alkylhydroperoxidase